MKSGIYLIKNIINNKVYVGSAVNIDIRWRKHKKLLKEKKHHSKHLQSAWNTYGEQNFKFEIIEEVRNLQHLLAYEQVYLDYYKSYQNENGYNTCKIAGSRYGIKCSEQTKKKISEAKHNISEQTRQKLREANKGRWLGRKHSEESRKKMREAKQNISEETRQKIREANIGKKHSEETKTKIRKSLFIDRDIKYYSFCKTKNKYLVRIFRKHIGFYNTEEEAKQAVIINLEKLKDKPIFSE